MNSRASIPGFVDVFCIVALSARAAQAALPDSACALLTQAQVAAALGAPVAAGANFGVVTACHWEESDKSNEHLSITLAILTVKGFDGGKKLAAMTSKISLEPVSGVGDDAYFLTTGPVITLGFMKGGAAYKVYFQHRGTLTVAEIKAKEKMLALDVLAKV